MPNQYTKKAAAKKAKAKTKPSQPQREDGPRVVLHPIRVPDNFAEVLAGIMGGEKPSINPCTKKAIDGNLPHFTLLPGDNFTPGLIREWIRLAQQHGTSEEKIRDAQALLKRIEQWRTDHPHSCKIPS